MKRLIILFTLKVIFAIGAQAQTVWANEGPKTKTSNTTSSHYKPTGHYLRFEAGISHIISVAYGYQINPYIMVGGGAGGGMYHERLALPIYAEVIFSTPRYKWSFFGDIKFGGGYYGRFGTYVFIDPRIGFSYKNLGLALGLVISDIDKETFPDFSIYYNIPLKIKR